MIRASLIWLLLLTTPAHADGRKKRIAGVVTTLAGAALVVAAAALANQATGDSDTITLLYKSGGVWNQTARDIDAEGRRDELAMKILYPIGGAVMLTGITVAVLGWWQDKHQKVAIGPQSVSWAVSF